MKGRGCLVDTGPIVALLVRNDRHHARAKELFASVPPPLATCEAVLSESCYLLQRAGVNAPQEVFRLIGAGVFDLSFHLAAHAEDVERIMKKYANVPASLADACLVCEAAVLQTPRILTFDSDFRIYRWSGHKAFEILSGTGNE